MLDFIQGFIIALRYCWSAFNNPSDDPVIRRLQWCSLVFCASGIITAVWGIVEFCTAPFGDPAWLYLALTTAGLWTIGVITGGLAESLALKNMETD